MPAITVNKANKQPAAPKEETYSQAQVDAMMATLQKALLGVGNAGTQEIFIHNADGPRPIQVKEYTPDHSKQLKEAVTFVIYQSFGMLWPLKGQWETPDNQPIRFRRNGTHVSDGALVTECLFATNDPVFVECLKSHPQYGDLVFMKTQVSVTAGGLKARRFQRWSKNVEKKNMVELRFIAAGINKELGKNVIPMTDDIESLKAEIIYAKVAQEEAADTISPSTIEQFKGDLVAE